MKPGEEVLDLWRKSSQGAHKVMIMGAAPEIKLLERALREMFSNEIHVYHSKSTYLELAPKVISKASALQLLLKQLYDIDLSEVIAFGDNYNDIELIQAVGLGIAVGNARDEVKAVAKEIALDSKQDGAAWIKQNGASKLDLIFADAWPGKYNTLDETLAMLKVGGFYIIDDMRQQPNWPDGHAEKAQKLVEYLEGLEYFQLTKLNWSTGVMIITRIR